MTGPAKANCRLPLARRLLRLLSCIRLDEVLVLQGTPVMGAILGLGVPTSDDGARGLIFAAGSLCLVAHVFVINDWSGIDGDLRDPNRATRTFAAKGVSRVGIGLLAVMLLGLTLLLFSLLGANSLVLASAILVLSTLYSAPAIHMKGRPILGSALHLAGGALHFLLGYATFSAVDARGIAIGCFFGLIFAAGHLVHETRGHEGDLLNGIRTNAVAFGKAQSFGWGLALFTAAYVLLVVLALWGALPRNLVFAAALYPVHLHASLRAARAGLTVESLLQLQRCYRLLYALVGVMLVVPVLLQLAAS